MTLKFQARKPEPSLVLGWFEFQLTLITAHRGDVLQTLATGSGTLRLAGSEAALLGSTRKEIEDFFDAQRAELEFLAMSELLATTEAVLRLDFRHRVKKRKKDSLSRRYLELQKQIKVAGGRVPIGLSEDILEALSGEGVKVSDFRGALKLRHWLAHGRYWQPKPGYQYTPEVFFDISRDLMSSIPS
jgi:hypothetical protein